MLLLIESRQRRSRHPRQQPLLGFEDDDTLTHADQHRRRFKTDIPAADDDNVPSAGEPGADSIHIRTRTDDMDPGKVAARRRQPPRRAARRPDQLAVSNSFAIRAARFICRRINRDDLAPGKQLDIQFGPCFLRAHHHALERLLACEIGLG